MFFRCVEMCYNDMCYDPYKDDDDDDLHINLLLDYENCNRTKFEYSLNQNFIPHDDSIVKSDFYPLDRTYHCDKIHSMSYLREKVAPNDTLIFTFEVS